MCWMYYTERCVAIKCLSCCTTSCYTTFSFYDVFHAAWRLHSGCTIFWHMLHDVHMLCVFSLSFFSCIFLCCNKFKILSNTFSFFLEGWLQLYIYMDTNLNKAWRVQRLPYFSIIVFTRVNGKTKYVILILLQLHFVNFFLPIKI